MKDAIETFKREVETNVNKIGQDPDIQTVTQKWLSTIAPYKYTYNFEWMGRPIIQFPQDMVAMQEIMWRVKPDLLIETGVAHGGSLIYYASLMELLGQGEILGIDVEIRTHNRRALESHPMFKRIQLLEGSSVSSEILKKVRSIAAGKKTMIVLDSNHTHDHVLSELENYSPFVSAGSYCVVMDTLIDDMPDEFFQSRPWGKGNNPKTAVQQFLKSHPEFQVDQSIEHKLVITAAPGGYLKRI